MISPALDKGLDILLLLNRHPEGMRFTELVEQLSLPRSTAVRLLHSLEEKGFVEKNGRRGQYVLGEAARTLGRTPGLAAQIAEVAQADLEAFHREEGKSVVVFYNHGDHTRCIARVCSEYTLQMQQLGEVRHDLLLHPWGILFYGDLEADEREHLWRNLDESLYAARPDRKAIEQRLREARAAGFAWDTLRERVRRVAVPLRLRDELVAAVATGWESDRPDPETDRAVAAHLGELALRIQAQL